MSQQSQFDVHFYTIIFQYFYEFLHFSSNVPIFRIFIENSPLLMLVVDSDIDRNLSEPQEEL